MKIKTPAFVYDERIILQNIQRLENISNKAGCELLYSIKSLSEPNILKVINPYVNGFSTSSLFESKLAFEIAGDREKIHIVSPGLNADEIIEISKYAKHITFNSVEQAKSLTKILNDAEINYIGHIRVNPQISLITDDKYNPCRIHSKLGVPIDELKKSCKELKNISGLHFHNNCEGIELNSLLNVVNKIILELGDWLKDLKYINIGGGYFFHLISDVQPFIDSVSVLKELGLKVSTEPGGTVTKTAGKLHSKVTDVFKSGDINVAILNASVNHLPEVYEFQYSPDIDEQIENGKYRYLIAGPTCLAGDLFGYYEFDSPLEIDSPITFDKVGAYSMVKSHTFNGVNIPSIYSITEKDELILRKEFDYTNYKSRWQ